MNRDFYPHRSALYMPGSNDRALQKAKTLSADLFIFDFEDAVSPDNKEKARTLVSKILKYEKAEFGQKKIISRVNSLDTDWGQQDIQSLKNSPTDGILFPKVNEAQDVRNIRSKLSILGMANKIELWIMVETPRCVINLPSILEEAKDLAGIVVGTNDLAKDLNLPKQENRFGLLHSLSSIILVSKAHNVLCLDGVYNKIGDNHGLSEELLEGKRLGYDGKTLIHPSQIEKANEIYSPSIEEIDLAKKIHKRF
jgi:citrate lyase beta subunit